MAVTVSGLYYPTWSKAIGAATAIVLNMTLTTHKIALFTNTITPNFDTDTAYAAAPYNANEVTTATYWPAGGPALSAAAVGQTSTAPTMSTSPAGTLMYDMGDVSVAQTTLVNARCALLYADALAAKNAIVLVNFGGDYSTSNGIFGIQWAATGVFTIDLTP
jgi:hypothetical protein